MARPTRLRPPHDWLGEVWRLGRYRIPNPLNTDVDALAWRGDDLPDKSLIELRVERRCVECAWTYAARRLDRNDWRRRWIEQRWWQVTAAIDRATN